MHKDVDIRSADLLHNFFIKEEERMKRFKNIRFLTVVLILAVIFSMSLTACGGKDADTGQTDGQADSTAASDEPVYGGTLVVALESEPSGLDPVFEGSDPVQVPARHIFETVLSQDTEGNVYPGVCTYELSDDGLTLTLTLRDGIKFHDGTDCTVEDVKASLERFLALAPNADYLADALEGMTVDGSSLILKLKQPAPMVPIVLSYEDQGPYVMKADICKSAGENKITDTSQLIGTGPYKLKEWKTGEYVLLEKYQDYTPTDNDAKGLAGKKYAYCDEIKFVTVTDSTARVNGVQTGAYDITHQIPNNLMDQLKADPNVKVYLQDKGTMPCMILDKEDGPTADVNLRKAILCCLDMNSIMLAAEGSEDFFFADSSWMPSYSRFFYDKGDNGEWNSFDPDKAKEYLAKSSYKGEPLVYLTSKDYSYMYDSAIVSSQYMKDIGINVDLQVLDYATLNEYRNDKTKFDIFSGGLTAKPYPSLIAFMGDKWAGKWVSAEKTKLVEQLNNSVDPKEQEELWHQLSKVIYDEVPIIKFGERRSLYITNSRVAYTYDGGMNYYWNSWISE